MGLTGPGGGAGKLDCQEIGSNDWGGVHRGLLGRRHQAQLGCDKPRVLSPARISPLLRGGRSAVGGDRKAGLPWLGEVALVDSSKGSENYNRVYRSHGEGEGTPRWTLHVQRPGGQSPGLVCCSLRGLHGLQGRARRKERPGGNVSLCHALGSALGPWKVLE